MAIALGRLAWEGADKQLDSLYTQDWRAEGRGIYLVLWVGDQEHFRFSNLFF